MSSQQENVLKTKKDVDLSKLNLNNPLIRFGIKASMKKMGQSFRAGLPAPQYKKTVHKTVKITMSDGVRLSADLFTPKADGPFPVILVRNPYASNDMLYNQIGEIFAGYGYAFLQVTVRGALHSEGDWTPFVHEINDGREIIDYIAAQPWCDGNIGSFGASYLGHTQWAIGNCGNPALKAMYISVYGSTPYHTFYRRGMFRQEIWTPWALQMMGDHRQKMGFSRATTIDALQFKPQGQLGEHLIQEPCRWYNQWIHATRPDDPYWAEGFWKTFSDITEHVKVPVFLEGGWFDIFLRPQLEAFRRLPEETKKLSRFWIGPWNHGGMPVGEIEFPGNISDPLFLNSALEWFNYKLKGQPYTHQLGVVECYNIGSGDWTIHNGNITASGKKVFYFMQGRLSEQIPNDKGSCEYIFDPSDVSTELSGNLIGIGTANDIGGPRFQEQTPKRKDLLRFVSDIQKETLHISGKICADLFVISDAPATAFAVKVCEQFPDGRIVNIRDDITDIRFRDEEKIIAYKPGETAHLYLEMLDIEWQIRVGSRIIVDVSSSNYPMYHIHSNTLEEWADTTNCQPAHQTVLFGDETLSKIVLPIK